MLEIMAKNIYNQNYNKYKYLETEILKLEKKYILNKKNEFSSLVNFSQNETEDFHNWFFYKEGYSAILVEKILERFEAQKDDVVLDPFCGSGTTLLVAKSKSLYSYGFDINPIATFISQAKLKNYDELDIKKIELIIKTFKLENEEKTDAMPKLSILDKIFSPKNLFDILKLKGFVERHKDDKIFWLLNTAFLGSIEEASNMKKDGNGIKYQKNKKIGNVQQIYLKNLKRILDSLRNNNKIISSIYTSNVFHDSFLNCFNYPQIEEESIDHVIFSPPYANCFDYCAVYKMELWMGGFVKDYIDFKKLRNMAIRSHVNGSLNPKLDFQYDIINWISEQVNKFKLWDNKIPHMIKAYFDDMTKVLLTIYRLLKYNSKCAIVIGNSSYKGFLIPTDLVLSIIAENIGFKVEEINIARSLRTSSQQMNKHEYLKKYLRESIIILNKKGN